MKREKFSDLRSAELCAIQGRVASASEPYTVKSGAWYERVACVSRIHLRHLALALTIGCISALSALTAAGAESRLTTDGIGGILAVAFVVLAVVDFRSSVAVVIFEVVLGGAGGHWVDYGGGLSGRILLIAVVTLRAVATTVVDWRRGWHPVFGRYGAHALAIAFLIPAIWMPLGLVDGNPRSYVIADGDSFFFFAFVLVVVCLARHGDGAWLRRMLFAACATSGAAYFLLIVATKCGLVGLDSVREWLSVRLAMGGVIGYMPGGEYRLFTAGSLFLLVGLVLTEQRLLARPRDVGHWLLAGLFCVDLVATYTRGLWLAALVGTAVVLALEVRTVRQLGFAVGIPAAVAGLALAVAAGVGLPLSGYVDARAASIAALSRTRHRADVANPSFERSSKAWQTADGGRRTLRVRRTPLVARAKRHSLELSNSVGAEDAYVFQNLEVRPDTRYSVGAWVDARALRQPAAGGRGLLVWDVDDGHVYSMPLTTRTDGWQHLSLTFATGASAQAIQIRLYAPRGRVFWDGVRFRAREARVVRSTVPVVPFVRPRPPVSRSALLDSSFERPGVWLRGGVGRRSVAVRRTASVARAKRHSLELSETAGAEDAYVFQNLEVRPDTRYSVGAWVDARALRQPAAGGRGLLVWDAQDGSTYTVPLTSGTNGWMHVSLTFRTNGHAREAQIRLYAPRGRVFWDAVRFRARGEADVRSRVPVVPLVRPRPPVSQSALRDSSFDRAGVWLRSSAGARTLRVLRRRSAARAGTRALALRNSVGAEDAYVFQNLEVRPDTRYSVGAWVDARALRQPAAGGRGLLVWDAQDGSVYTLPLTRRTNGWMHVSLTFRTTAQAREAQIRLYAPQGRVLWDAVRLAVPDVVQETTLPSGTKAAATMALASTAGGQSDAAGEASNSYRLAEANALLRYIRRRPIYGYGFGSVAHGFSTGYSYELSYLDLLFKTGLIGLLLYLSFPVRLVLDALRLRRGRASAKLEAPRTIGSAGVVAGVVVGVLIAGATNPYLFAVFGLVSILVMVAWVDDPHATADASGRGSA
jgi:hypothetical protein